MTELIDWRYVVLLKAIADAQIEAAGMTAENEQRKHLGQAMAYTDQNFFNVKDRLNAIWEANRL